MTAEHHTDTTPPVMQLTPPGQRPAARADEQRGGHLPAAARHLEVSEAGRRRRGAHRRPGRRPRRAAVADAALERLLGIEVEPPRPAGSPAGCGSPACPRPGRSTISTSPPNPASMRNSSASWPRCGSSTTPATSCWSAHPAPARPCSRSALARAAVDAGHRVYFTTAADLAKRCKRAALEGRWATAMRFYCGPRLLVIDEFAYARRNPTPTPTPPCSR